MREEIAARLKKARESQFRTATEAADSLSLKYQTYAAHENANRAFDAESAVLYSRRFKVSLDWLLTGHGKGPGEAFQEPPITTDAEVLRLLSRIEGLSETDITLAFGVIRNSLDARRAARAPSASHGQLQDASPRRELEPLERPLRRSSV